MGFIDRKMSKELAESEGNVKGLFGRIESRPYYEKAGLPLDSKIVFLNEENLEFVKGYKAEIDLDCGLADHYEIRIVLTGFSYFAAKALFKNLKPMNAEEIHGK